MIKIHRIIKFIKIRFKILTNGFPIFPLYPFLLYPWLQTSQHICLTLDYTILLGFTIFFYAQIAEHIQRKITSIWVTVLQLHGTLCKPAPRRITQFCWFCPLSWFSVVAVLYVHVLFMVPIPHASVVIKKYLSDACCVFWSTEKMVKERFLPLSC